jgi:predicted RNase H-like HicB family nuclease
MGVLRRFPGGVPGESRSSITSLGIDEDQESTYGSKSLNEVLKMKRQETQPPLRNEFTAVIERDGDWYIAYCPEIPGANGQGRTKDEARSSLAEAIGLILDDRRRDGLRGLPRTALREKVVVG